MALPERIGRYRVLGLVGQGAMGTVYRGRDETLDRDVALKVMSAGHGADADSRARFHREAKAAGRLQHPNIITIYELGEHEGSPFMALELLEGVDLQRAIEAGLRPDPKVTLPIVLQLLAGLGHAHESGIVHRDVKPSNVFLPRGRPVKIMDFGVARLSGGMTTAGMVVGTPNYMSPEQVRAGHIDGRSDLFSAGLILYELVTGEKAFRADSVVALLYKIVHEDPDLRLLPRGPQWEPLRAILAKALARDPDERYPDAQAMIGDLERALVELGGSPNWSAASDAGLAFRAAATPSALPQTETPAPPPVPVPSAGAAPQQTWVVAGGLAGAAVLVVGLALYTVNRRGATGDAAAGPTPGPAVTLGVPPSTAAQRPTATAPAASAAPPRPTAASPATTATPTLASAPATLVPRPTTAPPPTRPGPEAAPTASGDDGAPASPPEPAPEDARLAKAEELYEQRRYPAALAEARAILKRDPRNTKAKELAEDAEVEVVVENRIREATAALKKGDKDAALEAVKAGLVVKPSDSRLLELWKAATKE